MINQLPQEAGAVDTRLLLAGNDNERTSTIELKRRYGITPEIERRNRTMGRAAPRRAAQSAEERTALKIEYDGALAALGRIEGSAGPTLGDALRRSKAFQAAFDTSRELKSVIHRRLGQRKGLLKLMQVEFHTDYPAQVTDRSRLYVEHMLRASANVAALTGSNWPSTRKWFDNHLPILMRRLTPDRLELDFQRYVADAAAELAARISTGDRSLLTGPTPFEIASAFRHTRDQLKFASANTCGLTCVDPQDRQTRDRERKARDRHAVGRKPQSERTIVADMNALASRLGCSVSTIQRRRRDGTLDAFIAEHECVDQKVSTDTNTLNGGHILVTAQAPAPAANYASPSPAESGFAGRYITLAADACRQIVGRYPELGEDFAGHLDAIDATMRKTPAENCKVVLRNLLRDRARLARKVLKPAA